ncbi:uncharacterized protein FMAN_00131 [Fusarium mangiferae]|uniref:Uncharacterized protein n=1 Tax=Fusarium mangiferae TaxID=192010 RepID=A0A1L7TVL2_FUSMA|nr:uncharacterized protein FMAN_00131 [Fusarium mangiferae]CVL02628.1 uncharacterized protein FMAN_00131 [Fusarium mangiferae]
MGFFDNLWDGVKSAGGWVLDHSGDIASAVGTVGKIAGLLTLDNSTHAFAADTTLNSQEIETDSQKLAKYHQNFASVSDQLTVTAKSGVKAPPKTTGQTTTVDDSLVGLWTDPKGLSSDGKPSTSMYHDLSAFMGTMNIPVSWKDDSGHVHDTVNEIGQVFFAKTGPQDLAELSKSENPIAKVNAEVSTQDGYIHACHVYYPIPMGNGNSSLHSAIHLSYTTNVGAP